MSQQANARRRTSKGTVLITGASSGIGAIYADRFAGRGYDLVLVARDRQRLDALATRLSQATASEVTVIAADLTNPSELARVEELLRTDVSVTVLVNNAGVGAPAPLLDSSIDRLGRMIDLNVSAVVHLTYAALPGFLKRGGGSIVNIASAVGIAPETLNAVYGGTKAFLLAFSLSLHKEFAAKQIRVQAVLPGATATDFWRVEGTPIERLPSEIVMEADDLVDAALAGLDQGEVVTIPSLPDLAEWDAYEAARQKMIPRLSLRAPALRYGVARPQAGAAVSAPSQETRPPAARRRG